MTLVKEIIAAIEKLDVTSESVMKMLEALRKEKYDDDKTEVLTNVV